MLSSPIVALYHIFSSRNILLTFSNRRNISCIVFAKHTTVFFLCIYAIWWISLRTIQLFSRELWTAIIDHSRTVPYMQQPYHRVWYTSFCAHSYTKHFWVAICHSDIKYGFMYSVCRSYSTAADFVFSLKLVMSRISNNFLWISSNYLPLICSNDSQRIIYVLKDTIKAMTLPLSSGTLWVIFFSNPIPKS